MKKVKIVLVLMLLVNFINAQEVIYKSLELPDATEVGVLSNEVQNSLIPIMRTYSGNSITHTVRIYNMLGLIRVNNGYRLYYNSSTYNGFGNLGARAVDFSSPNPNTNSGATGADSFAVGNTVYSSGYFSAAFGREVYARSGYEFAIGSYGVDYNPSSRYNVNNNDRIFSIANGTSDSNRSMAMIVTKAGKITAPSTDISDINDPKSLITNEYLLAPKDLFRLNATVLPTLTSTDRVIALDSADNKLKFWNGTNWNALY